MATESPQLAPKTFAAGGTITQYRYVKLSAAKTVVQCSGVTDKPIGVSQEGATVGQPVAVCMLGVTKLEGDANLAVGDSIGTSADGQAAAYTAADTTKYITGQVIDDNSAAGGLITAAIDCINIRTLA